LMTVRLVIGRGVFGFFMVLFLLRRSCLACHCVRWVAAVTRARAWSRKWACIARRRSPLPCSAVDSRRWIQLLDLRSPGSAQHLARFWAPPDSSRSAPSPIPRHRRHAARAI
jgi:hypothetical protein